MSAVIQIYRQSLDHLLAPVVPYLQDPAVSEVMINGHDEIYVERHGKVQRVAARFADPASLRAAARNITQYAGKRLDPDIPSIEARLPDGSRVHILQPPAARRGLCIAIRKFSQHRLRLRELIERDALSREAAEFLAISVRLAKNLIVSGGTGSGKTTLLNCLSEAIPQEARIVVIEDATELQLQQEHVVPLEAQPADRHGRGGISIRELFRASLRMRPDRIIVGECRGGEALDMIQAMTSGHAGSMSTCHANGPLDALNRLETMALMSGVEMPLLALRSQLISAVDLIVQIVRQRDGGRRISQITEVLKTEDRDRYQLRDIFRLDMSRGVGGEGGRGELVWTGTRPTFGSELRERGDVRWARLSARLWQIPVATVEG